MLEHEKFSESAEIASLRTENERLNAELAAVREAWRKDSRPETTLSVYRIRIGPALSDKSLSTVWKWVDAHESDPAARAYNACCEGLGGVREADKYEIHKALNGGSLCGRGRGRGYAMLRKLCEIETAQYHARDTLGRLILEKIRADHLP